MNERSSSPLRIIGPIVVLLIVAGAVVLMPNAVPLRGITLASVSQFLTSLLLAALLVERVLDVFLTIWRAPTSEAIEAEAKRHPESSAERIEKEAVLQTRKAGTRTIAMWSALLIGILVSAAGMRSLSWFVEPGTVDALPATQASLFIGVDILLTGGVIAGGSDGIHKIAEVLRNFLKTSSAQAARPRE